MDDFTFDFSNDAITADLAADLASSEHGSTSKKRSRSGTPTPSGRPSKAASIKPPGQDEVLAEKLRDPAQRNAALNELVKASMVNFQLEGEAILDELSKVVVECLGWKGNRFDQKNKRQPTFSVSRAWEEPLLEELKDWNDHWKKLREPEKINCIEVVLVILRNFSYAATNARLLAFSPHILAILIGSLYEEYFSTSPSALTEDSSPAAAGTNPLALPSLSTLVNLLGQLFGCHRTKTPLRQTVLFSKK